MTVDTTHSNRFLRGDVLTRGCRSSRWHPYAAPLRLWACRQGALRKPARVSPVQARQVWSGLVSRIVWQSRLVASESLAAAVGRTVTYSRCLSVSTQSVSRVRFRVSHSTVPRVTAAANKQLQANNQEILGGLRRSRVAPLFLKTFVDQ